MQEGFARFAVQPYSTNPQHLNNLFVHLTNSSIQKDHDLPTLPDFLQPTLKYPSGNTKIALGRLWELLAKISIEKDVLWPSICNTVLAALFAAQDSIPHQVCNLKSIGTLSFSKTFVLIHPKDVRLGKRNHSLNFVMLCWSGPTGCRCTRSL